jgi:hypothetical protein
VMMWSVIGSAARTILGLMLPNSAITINTGINREMKRIMFSPH